MNLLKKIPIVLFLSFVMMSFSQCASTYKLENKAPLKLGKVYYNTWAAGARFAGSGINLFIPVESNPKNIVLDSVYFKNKQVELEHINDSLFVGRFVTRINQQQDIIMSNEPFAEYGNKVPEPNKKIPFELKENECAVSYKSGKKITYFKITNIYKKRLDSYPGMQP